jgi:hypothetical protein
MTHGSSCSVARHASCFVEKIGRSGHQGAATRKSGFSNTGLGCSGRLPPPRRASLSMQRSSKGSSRGATLPVSAPCLQKLPSSWLRPWTPPGLRLMIKLVLASPFPRPPWHWMAWGCKLNGDRVASGATSWVGVVRRLPLRPLDVQMHAPPSQMTWSSLL